MKVNSMMFVVFLLPVLFNACFACLAGWNSYNGSCYKLVDDRESWPEAMDRSQSASVFEAVKFTFYTCNDWDSSLASISSAGEQMFMGSLIKHESDDIWVGGADLRVEGVWFWEPKGDRVDYTHWQPNQPDNSHDNENCMVLIVDKKYVWADRACSDHRKYVCEKPDEKIVPIIG